MNKKRFDLVIFDCDGVLVDSELITNRIFVRMLNELGLARRLRCDRRYPTGVRAGVAAGMTVFGYCALTPKPSPVTAGAHRTFERMRDLPELLSIGV